MVDHPRRCCLKLLSSVPSSDSVWVLSGYDVRQGKTVVELGGGRTQPDAAIDPSVGLSQIALAGESKKEARWPRSMRATTPQWAGRRFVSALKWDQPKDVLKCCKDELTALH